MKKKTRRIIRILAVLFVTVGIGFFIFALHAPQASWSAPVHIVYTGYVAYILITISLVTLAVAGRAED